MKQASRQHKYEERWEKAAPRALGGTWEGHLPGCSSGAFDGVILVKSQAGMSIGLQPATCHLVGKFLNFLELLSFHLYKKQNTASFTQFL